MGPKKSVVLQHVPFDRFARCRCALEMFPLGEEAADPLDCTLVLADIVVAVPAVVAVGVDTLATDIVVPEDSC